MTIEERHHHHGRAWLCRVYRSMHRSICDGSRMLRIGGRRWWRKAVIAVVPMRIHRRRWGCEDGWSERFGSGRAVLLGGSWGDDVAVRIEEDLLDLSVSQSQSSRIFAHLDIPVLHDSLHDLDRRTKGDFAVFLITGSHSSVALVIQHSRRGIRGVNSRRIVFEMRLGVSDADHKDRSNLRSRRRP